MIDYLKTIRTISLIFLAGAATGAYAAYGYEHANTNHIMGLVLKGGCAQPDMDRQPRWFQCADYYIATQLQHQDEQRDAEVTAVLNDMAKHEPKAKAVKVKQ